MNKYGQSEIIISAENRQFRICVKNWGKDAAFGTTGPPAKWEPSSIQISWQLVLQGEESNMHKSFSNKSKQDFDETVEKFQKHLSSSGTDLARVMLDVGKMSEAQKIFVESSQTKIAKLEEEFSRNDVMLKEEMERSEREFAEMNENLSERRREIGALQRKLESRAKLIIEEFNQSMDEVFYLDVQ